MTVARAVGDALREHVTDSGSHPEPAREQGRARAAHQDDHHRQPGLRGNGCATSPPWRQSASTANRPLLDVERDTTAPVIGAGAFRAVADPVVVSTQRASA